MDRASNARLLRCDERSPVRARPGSGGRCGDFHTTPQVRPIGFDDLVRKTAAGLIVPLEYASGGRKQRFWVPSGDRERYLDNGGGADVRELDGNPQQNPRANGTGPTCRPRIEARPVARCPGCGWPLVQPDGEPCPERRRCDGTAEVPAREAQAPQVEIENVPSRYAAYDITSGLRCIDCGRPCSTTDRAGRPRRWRRHGGEREQGHAA